MACLWKHPNSKFWSVQYTDADGRRRNRSTKLSDRKAALKVMHEWQKAADAARHGELCMATSARLLEELAKASGASLRMSATVRQILSDFLDAAEDTQKAESTRKLYHKTTARFLDWLADRADNPARQFTTRDAEAWRKSLLDAGLSRSSANLNVTVLSAAFARAVKRGDLPSNPFLQMESLPNEKSVRTAFSPEQIGALLSVADPEWSVAITLGAIYGLRLNDAANLKRGDLDMESGVLRFLPQKTARSGKELVLPLTEDLREAVAKLPLGLPSAPLLPTLAGKSTAVLSTTFSHIMQTAGIDCKRESEKAGKGRARAALSFHSLRHYCITAMHESGVSPVLSKAIAGHVSDAVHGKYSHVGIDALRDAMAKIPRIGA